MHWGASDELLPSAKNTSARFDMINTTALCIFIVVGMTEQGNGVPVSINLNKSLRNVSEQFLSVTIGSNSIGHNWSNLDLKSVAVINMAKALAPAMLRIGGTSEDFVIFKATKSTESPHTGADHVNITLSASQWDTINEFAQEVGWDIIFGLNVFLRNPWPHGPWDTSNAEELMRYSIRKQYNINWELGNEPDLFPKVTNTTVIEADQLARDFKILQQLLVKLDMKPKYVAGPDVTRGTLDLNNTLYFENFLKSLDKGIINAITWHHYYESGETAILSDFTNAKLLDTFIDNATNASYLTDEYQKGAQVWLGETSSCYHGGAPGISDTYVAGFMWLDKLGLAAVINHTLVLRQTFSGGSYSLLDSNSKPLPDFWLSALYKKLVGVTVLEVDGSMDYGRNVRVYAHCAKTPLYPEGDVVLIVLNLNPMETSVTLTDNAIATKSRDVYWLTPPGGTSDLQSKQVTLNGKLMQLVNDTTLPDFTPTQQAASTGIRVPGLSFGFYVFKDVKAKACL